MLKVKFKCIYFSSNWTLLIKVKSIRIYTFLLTRNKFMLLTYNSRFLILQFLKRCFRHHHGFYRLYTAKCCPGVCSLWIRWTRWMRQSLITYVAQLDQPSEEVLAFFCRLKLDIFREIFLLDKESGSGLN